jgi:ComF family protein
MVNQAWQSACSIAQNIEARLVMLLGTRPCQLCDSTIVPPPLSFKVIYQSRFICQACLKGLKPQTPILVSLGLGQDVSNHIRCISICPYEGTARQAIRAFKYQDKQELASDLARTLEAGMESLLKPANQPNKRSGIVLIAVPLHKTKLEERGFNQSELITRELSKRTGIRCDTRALIRARATTPQYGLTKGERAINVNSAFKANQRAKNKNVILVDDVLTSGATAAACAQALLEAGAESVSVLTIARALLRSEKSISPEQNISSQQIYEHNPEKEKKESNYSLIT